MCFVPVRSTCALHVYFVHVLCTFRLHSCTACCCCCKSRVVSKPVRIPRTATEAISYDTNNIDEYFQEHYRRTTTPPTGQDSSPLTESHDVDNTLDQHNDVHHGGAHVPPADKHTEANTAG